MLRRDRQIRTQIHQLADASLVALSFWAAYLLRANPGITAWLKLDPIPPDAFNNISTILIAFALIPITPLILESQGFYNRQMLGSRGAIMWPLFKGCAITTVALVLAGFALHLNPTMPRLVPVLFGPISFALIYFKEEALRQAFKSGFAQGQFKRRFILVGTETETVRMCRELEGRKDETVAVVAQFDLSNPIPQLVQMLHDHAIYGVILSAKHTYFEEIENVIKACELEGVEVWLLADFFTTQISRTSFDELLGRPLLIFRTAPDSSWPGIIKQMMDFCGALVLLVVVAPLVMLPVAIFIKLTSPGPVLFRQQRSGQSGAPFTLYKFRTMVTNAEQFKHELEAMNEMRGPVFKVTNDPRVTPIGKFLRRYSLDELPQLWNVLRGEMSLVGPRPLPVDEVRRFNDFAHRRRLSVKPGLTCLWQVQGRNEITDFKDWVRLDLEYIDNWSLWLDLKILVRTIPAIFIATGAK
jgi:exopolysaccharide biosynthesis polyprenyl glycosylphosphotransferase